MIGTAVLAAISAAALAAAELRLRNAARAERSGRREIFADCLPLFEGAVLKPDPSGYDVLRGRYRGFEAALRPVAEQLAFRRLPQLWLIASVRLPTGAEATLDVLRRPNTKLRLNLAVYVIFIACILLAPMFLEEFALNRLAK
ncbi:hypothetical protein ACIKTA_05255, partial [Hansschlegelia beijingensis]